MPDGSEKFFPNVIEEHVKPFLDGDNPPLARQSGEVAQQRQEMSSEDENESSEKTESRRTKFMKAMHDGGVIIEYHENKRGNYTVRVKLPSGDTEVFPNISEEHFSQFKTKIAQEKPPKQEHPHNTFEKVMNEGGCIEEVVKFESYSVHVKMPQGNIENFGNISKEHLERYKDRIDLHPELVSDRNIDHQHRKGDTFEACMQQPGATIIDYHAHPFYSLHVKTPDNKMEYYSHVSEKRLEKYQHLKPQ
jgi:hypothetical protein